MIKTKNRMRQHAILLPALVVLFAGLACGTLIEFDTDLPQNENNSPAAQVTSPPIDSAQKEVPTLAPSDRTVVIPELGEDQQAGPSPAVGSDLLVNLHQALQPGVVNISVLVSRAGQSGTAAGSGFIIDEAGTIVTNNHVVEGADSVIVIFYNGFQAEAEVVGTDADSDLAVLRVENMPAGVHPLPLGDSNQVRVGEWVVAIGNPFGVGSSMTIGIVSATGRTIASGATPFSIPQAIQTDAAINPGNSGGPLLNLNGEVIGVNAQIATGGVSANSGVGFAIPVNVVRQVAPVLLERGSYQWPWLGVRGESVNLAVQDELNLEAQQGAYIASVEPGGPAERAGLRPGDVVIESNGEPVLTFDDLLTDIAFSQPGDQLQLTILRGGSRETLTVTLQPRPRNTGPLR